MWRGSNRGPLGWRWRFDDGDSVTEDLAAVPSKNVPADMAKNSSADAHNYFKRKRGQHFVLFSNWRSCVSSAVADINAPRVRLSDQSFCRLTSEMGRQISCQVVGTHRRQMKTQRGNRRHLKKRENGRQSGFLHSFSKISDSLRLNVSY